MTPPDPNRLSGVLHRLAHEGDSERVSLGDMVAHLDRRAFGPLLVLFALPNVLPNIPGTSLVLGLPLVLITFQMLWGSRPWFPPVLARRSLRREDLGRITARALPWLQKAEAFLTPRLAVFSHPWGERALGLVCFLLAVLLALPIPFGNLAPAFALLLIGLGLVEKDGLWILAGLGASVFAVGLLSGMAWGMLQGVMHLTSSFFA